MSAASFRVRVARGAALAVAITLVSVFLLRRNPAAPTPAAPPNREPSHAGVVPTERPDAWWRERHERIGASIRRRFIDADAPASPGILFVGDSITQGWEEAGRETWERVYAPRGAVNLGIGGDRTQHVLWRLSRYALGSIEPGRRPRLAVVLIGTNNWDRPASEIAGGVRAVVGALRESLPGTRVLLLAILPRADQGEVVREKLARASEAYGAIADGREVVYLDVGRALCAADGTIPSTLMPDGLHPSARGYDALAEAMEPTIRAMLEPR